MSKDRAWDDEGDRNDDDDDNRGRRSSRGSRDDEDDDDDRPRRKRRRESGSGDSTGKVLLILFGIGFLTVLVCCGGCFGLGLYGNKMEKEGSPKETDAFFAEALHSNNQDTVYKNADPAFKGKYTESEYKSFMSAHPNLFARDSLYGGTLRDRYADSVNYTTIVSRPGGLGDPGVRLYFRKGASGKLVLAGISPGLDAAVPYSIRFDPNKIETDD